MRRKRAALNRVTVNALTVVAKIKPGEEEELKELLKRVNDDAKGNPYMRLAAGHKTHCMRCAVIYDTENGHRLLLAAENDCDLEDYLRELVLISPGLDGFWDKCEGYQGRAGFAEFIRKNSYETQAFYIGFRDETVLSIQNKIVARELLERLLDETDPKAGFLLGALSNLPPSRKLGKRLRKKIAAWRNDFRDWWLSLALLVVKPLAVAGETKDFPLVTSVFDPQAKPAGLAPTSLDGQMITITEVRPDRRLLLRLSLAANEFLGKYGYPPGLFADVGTLFSFRWVVIDNNRRLIFLSVFDGSWQNYMGDFIDKIIWALDGIYKNTKGYPPGGMTQVTEFQRWILDHQYEPQLLFKAYPAETVMKLIKDREISRAAGDKMETGIDSAELRQLTRKL